MPVPAVDRLTELADIFERSNPGWKLFILEAEGRVVKEQVPIREYARRVHAAGMHVTEATIPNLRAYMHIHTYALLRSAVQQPSY